MDTLWQDIRFGVRMLWKARGLTAIAVLALALGIGANSAIFSAVNALLLRPLPYDKPDQLVVLWENNQQLNLEKNEASPANFNDWREQAGSFKELAAFMYEPLNLTSKGGEPEWAMGSDVTPNMMSMLGLRPALGRAFTPEEGKSGADPVLIISHSLWQRRFGGDPSVLGQSLTLNGKSYAVVGVMPKDFHFDIIATRGFQLPVSIDVWMPLALDGEMAADRASHFLNVMGRLKDDRAVTQAQAELDTISARLQQKYPETNQGRRVRVVPLKEELFGNISLIFFVLLGAVGFVLLIACANVANLLLARAAARRREMAVRIALGAGRARLARQLLTESLLMALLGGALGLALAYAATNLLVALAPSNIPRIETIGIDARVLGVTFLISLVTGFLFGLAPALQASQVDLNETLKEGGRTQGAGTAGNRALSLLVVSEVALSLVLLIGAGLMIRSFVSLQQVDPGFNAHNVLTAWLYLPPTKYDEGPKMLAFHEQLTERISHLPGVKAVSTVSDLPLGGTGMTMGFQVEGSPEPLPGQKPEANYRVIAPSYFDVMGVSLMRGRAFTEQDRDGSPGVVVVNQTLAQRYWPGQDAVGKRISFGGAEGPWLSVVGVVADVKHRQLDARPEVEAYVPYKQNPWPLVILTVRTEGDPLALAGAVRRAAREVDPDQPVFGIKTMEQHLSDSVAARRLAMTLLGGLAALALLLSTVGIYGVISYFVTQRTQEIGIRMALGARQSDVLRLVVGRGLRMAAIGVVIGLLAAFALTRVMTSILYGVGATDLLTFIAVPSLLIAVALLASFLPARRATRLDPLNALRHQ
ncbi:MAG: ABC transporter permease [Acidobacteria bacterium]|nr:ABC transporter permease [Acidobacteriota bacterium]